jgi:hypothetical protein
MLVPTSNVDAETPVSLHGDIDENPIPAPNAMSSSVNARCDGSRRDRRP